MGEPTGPAPGGAPLGSLGAAYRTLGRTPLDAGSLDEGLSLGRVSIVHGATGDVIWFSPDGLERTTMCRLASSLDPRPVAGDWVGLRDETIVSVLARRSALRRPDPHGHGVQVLAANLDLVLLVVPIDRGLNERMLERFAVMAWDSGARPYVVLTKADGATDIDGIQRTVRSLVPDVELLTTSSVSGRGIEHLRSVLHRGVTAVMLGASGAGKTSLLNALEGSAEVTRKVSRAGEGRHATTTRKLYRLTGGGVLLDIPGIRLLDLMIGQAGVGQTFSDIEMIADRCRFRNCSHRGDDGCAVEAAVAAGALPAARLDSWRAIHGELEGQRRSRDPSTNAQRPRRTPTAPTTTASYDDPPRP